MEGICTRLEAGPRPTRDSKSTACRRRGCACEALLNTACICSPWRPVKPSEAIASVASDCSQAAKPNSSDQARATTLRAILRADLGFIGLHDRVDGGGVDQTLLNEDGFQCAHARRASHPAHCRDRGTCCRLDPPCGPRQAQLWENYRSIGQSVAASRTPIAMLNHFKRLGSDRNPLSAMPKPAQHETLGRLTSVKATTMIALERNG